MKNLQTSFNYELLAQDGLARRGRIHTAHGTVETPAFMPVGTQGTVKGLRVEDVKRTGADIILGNTYHLYLRPGHKVVEEFGGLQKFMNWQGPILTDSGGYQVYSLSGMRKMREEGVTFRSHIDGSKHFIGPEESTAIQHSLNATISMVLDECTGFPITEKKSFRSMERSMRWAKRSREAFVQRQGYGQFGIVQGGPFIDQRQKSAEALMDIGFEGYAIGSMMLGEPYEIYERTVRDVAAMLPQNQPRYVMGVGYPSDLVRSVLLGADMFDCVLPTRNARNGMLFTSEGVVRIKNEQYKQDQSPLDPACSCTACTHYTKGYLRHLFVAKEALAVSLLTEHNIHFYQHIMKTMRDAIEAGTAQQTAAKLLEKIR